MRIRANDNGTLSNDEKTAVMIFYEDRPYAHMDILGIHKGNLRLSTLFQNLILIMRTLHFCHDII